MDDKEKIKMLEERIELLEKIIELREKVAPTSPLPVVYPPGLYPMISPQPWTGDPLEMPTITIC